MIHPAQVRRLAGILLAGWAIAAGAASRLAAQCVGDCNADGMVRISEVQRCVNIGSGAQPLSACGNADQNHDGGVSPSEVDACIASFLNAATCPRVSTPGPTNTAAASTTTPTLPAPTATRTNTPTATRTNTTVPTNSPTNPPPPTSTPTNSPPSATSTPAIRTCAFNGATDNSSLQICFLGVCPAAIDISGAITIACDAAQDGNGQRNCQCALQSLNPFVLSGVGTICVEPATGTCPGGKVDCDGGSALNLDTIADTSIGGCTGNSDCQTQCATHCAGLGYAVYNAACENFCQGGTRDGQPCICDLAGGATCSGGQAGVNDCPGGSCEGKDNELDTDCHCTCINEAFGAVSPAGSLECRLGVAIRVEADPVCDNNQVLVRLPGQCAPFTSSSATATILKTNEGTGNLGPFPTPNAGTAGTCAEIDAGSVAGYTLASDLAFFDSTIGDLISRLKIDCQ